MPFPNSSTQKQLKWITEDHATVALEHCKESSMMLLLFFLPFDVTLKRFPFRSGSSQGFVHMSSQEDFPCH